MKSLLLSATALAILGVPALSVAQNYRAPAPSYQTPAHPAQPQQGWRQAPQAPAYNPGPVMRQPGGAPNYGQRGPAPIPQSGQTYGQRTPSGPQNWGGDRGPAGRGFGQGYRYRGGGQDQGAGGGFAQYRGRGEDRGHDGDWNRRDHDDRGRQWWAGRRGFEGYEGPRNGYWYAPGRGYYSPGEAAYDFAWSLGAFVPYELRNCGVDDPYAYGVPPAPYGYCWIFLDDRLVMIDLRSGAIVQMADEY